MSAVLVVVARLRLRIAFMVHGCLRRWRRSAQCSAWFFIGYLRRLISGEALKPPEIGGFTSACLRRWAEVSELTSGGLPEVPYGVKYGEFSVVAHFCRRFFGVLSLLAPEDPLDRNAKPGWYLRLPPGLGDLHLRSLRSFEDQDLEPCLIDYVIARN